MKHMKTFISIITIILLTFTSIGQERTRTFPINGDPATIRAWLQIPSSSPSTATPVISRKALFVSQLHGDDNTAVREDMTKPWLTIKAASDASLGGDTIVIVDGNFVQNPVIEPKVGVSFYLAEGVIIDSTGIDNTFSIYVDGQKLVIRGRGYIKPMIEAFGSNQTLDMEVDRFDGTIDNFVSAKIKVNTANLSVLGSLSIVEISPLTEGKASVTLNNLGSAYASRPTIYNCEVINIFSFGISLRLNLVGGTFSDQAVSQHIAGHEVNMRGTVVLGLSQPNLINITGDYRQ